MNVNDAITLQILESYLDKLHDLLGFLLKHHGYKLLLLVDVILHLLRRKASLPSLRRRLR